MYFSASPLHILRSIEKQTQGTKQVHLRERKKVTLAYLLLQKSSHLQHQLTSKNVSFIIQSVILKQCFAWRREEEEK